MHNQSLAPKNFFLQIGIVATLYASAVSFLAFLFAVIDNIFPDTYYTDSNYQVRFAISTLIIVFPLFIWLSRVYRNFVANNAELKESRLRRWITYFTLFITGITMAIDAIVLVNAFLGGENIAESFILKVLSVFLVAGGIFMYGIKDLKGYFDGNAKRSKLWSIVVSAIVLLSVIGGFMIIGSPAHQRNVNLDAQRVSDLSNIQYQVVNYYQAKGVLPTTLDQMKDPLSGDIIPTDPETKLAYEYKTGDKLTFNVCADFKTVSSQTTTSPTYYAPLEANENWQHKAEHTCFTRTIDPDKYPLLQKQK